jgi:hypothetical protein
MRAIVPPTIGPMFTMLQQQPTRRCGDGASALPTGATRYAEDPTAYGHLLRLATVESSQEVGRSCWDANWMPIAMSLNMRSDETRIRA